MERTTRDDSSRSYNGRAGATKGVSFTVRNNQGEREKSETKEKRERVRKCERERSRR